jgi:hypothetical protein
MKALNLCSVAVVSLFSVLIVGCADVGVGDDGSDGAAVKAAEEALTVNGQTVTWTLVGNPSAANRIAACQDYTNTIYALNNDYRLYRGNGTDSGWSYRGYPSAARDIACTSSSWVWALNADKTFYYNVSSGSDSGWVYEGKAGYAEQFGTGNMITALNYDDKVYSYDNYSKAWTYRATFAGATEASSARIGNTTALRWFVVKGGTVYFTTGDSTALTAFPLVDGGVTKTVRDVSAAQSDVVWALTEERKLYKATFREISCTDNRDNDSDGLTDGFDNDCTAKLAASTCAQLNSGGGSDRRFCISRLGFGSNSLAVCNGTSVTSVETGNWCVQVGAGGSDYVGYLQ